MNHIVLNNTELFPKKVIFNGNEVFVFKNTDGTPYFSRYRISIAYISVVNFQNTSTNKKYVDFVTTAASQSNTTYVNTYLKNNTPMSDTINLTSYDGFVVSLYTVTQIPTALTYTSMSSNFCRPQLTDTNLSYLIPVRSRLITSISGAMLYHNSATYSALGIMDKLMLIDSTSITTTDRTFNFHLFVDEAYSTNLSEMIRFTTYIASTPIIDSTARLCSKYKITVSAASAHDIVFSILGQSVTLTAGQTEKNGYVEISGIANSTTKELYLYVTNADQEDYTAEKSFSVALSPFMIS